MIPGERAAWGAIIVAAGRAERFGGRDKTLELLAGRPVFEWSIEAFCSEPRIRKIALVHSNANVRQCTAFARRHACGAECIPCAGGDSRPASVRAGLQALGTDLEFVVVHDAARPLVTIDLLSRVLDAAEMYGAAVPMLPVSGTLLIESAQGESAGPLARSSVREAQTPQAARREALDAALAAYPHETDESSALYRSGCRVALVRGLRANIKITEPDDLLLAEALLASRRST